MSELDKAQSTPDKPEPILRPPLGMRGWVMKAGEWLQRPPGKHMGTLTTLVVLLLMVLLVWVSSWF